jgi:hypothetical protein
MRLIFQDTCRHYQKQQTLDELLPCFNKSSSFHRFLFHHHVAFSITGKPETGSVFNPIPIQTKTPAQSWCDFPVYPFYQSFSLINLFNRGFEFGQVELFPANNV